jgi:amino acid transporter
MNKRKIGLWSATFLGISTIIGSGWLFAPYKAVQAAGPAALLSWVIGAFIVGLLAMCFSEIAGLYPIRGLSAVIPTISHNKYFGFPFALANWLGVVAVISLEAEGTIQYLIRLVPQFDHLFFYQSHFTTLGSLLAMVLVIFFCLTNYWGIKVLAHTNNIFSIVKVVVPIVAAVVIMGVAFHPKNFTVMNGTFAPYGYSSVFSAILACGIIVAFNGFQTVISFANEIKNPNRNIPLSIGLALAFCLGIYLLLQLAFIGGVPTDMVAKGWDNLHFIAPLVDLPILIGVSYIATIIYFGATVSPCGSGVAFTGTATRMFTAMARYKQMPKYFDNVHPQYGVSRRSLIFNIFLSVLFLFLFPSWSDMAVILGLFHVLSYLPVPIALVIFRDKLKGSGKHPFKIPFGKSIALVVFIVFTCLFATAHFKPVLELFILFAIFQAIFIGLNVRSLADVIDVVRQCGILILYFLGLLILIWLAPQNTHVLNTLWYTITMIIFSIVFFLLMCITERTDVELLEATVGLYHD